MLFLNGEYWGVYALEEDPDPHYFEDHFGVDPDQCNIIKKWRVPDSGDSLHWHDLYQWMWTADLSLNDHYDEASNLIDIDNFIDYQIFELYSSNVEWPKNNVRCWQPNQGRWRWIFYDGDGCFFRDWDVFANATDTSDAVYPSNACATLFFRKLIQNPTFFDRFETRFHELLSNQLSASHTLPLFQSLCAEIKAEVPNQAERFGFPENLDKWVQDTASVSAYLRNQNAVITHKLDQFVSPYNLLNVHTVPSMACFPNPSNALITLIFNHVDSEISSLRIFDMQGRLVYEDTVVLKAGFNKLVFNPPLAPGLYVLKLGQMVTKIVRQ